MKVLAIATMSQSLALQSPASWDELIEGGADITFAAARDRWSDQLEEWGTYVELPGARRPVSLDHVRFMRECNRLLASRRWDLIQLQTPIASTLARLTPQLGNAHRVVYVAHGFHFHADARPLTNAIVRRLETELARRCDAVAVVAKEDFAAAAASGIDRHTLLWQLPGAGVDTASFAAAAPEQPFGTPHALFCGDMIRRKNPVLAVETALELHARGHPFPLVLIGTGPLLDDVLSRSAPLVSAGLLLHVPWTDRVAEYMAGAGIHLLPSRQEGVPRVTMEAMAARVPTVATSNRGSRELAASGAGPLMPRTSDASAWAATVLAWWGTRLDAGVASELDQYDVHNFRRSYRSLLEHLGLGSRPVG